MNCITFSVIYLDVVSKMRRFWGHCSIYGSGDENSNIACCFFYWFIEGVNLSDILECNIERRGRNDLLFLVGVEIHCQLP